MKLLPLAAAGCLIVSPFYSTLADDTPSRTIPELTLEERIVDLLEAVEDESPEIYRRMAELPREDALARIMRALDSGVVPVSAAASGRKGASAEGQSRPVQVYPELDLTEKHFLYFRFDELTEESILAATQTLKAKYDESASAGAIFDLRTADGGLYDKTGLVAEQVRKLNCPVMVLVSGRTCGAGELLAAVLRRDCGAVLLGTETAGSIFPVKRIYVNDVAWFVPNPPPEYAGISPYALKPDLEKASDVRLSYDELKESTKKLDGDPVLRLAADLLTMKAAVKPAEEQAPAAR